MRFTRRRRVVERARAGTTPRESRDACRAEIRDAETCWIGSRPSSGGGGLWRREARERRFRASTRRLEPRPQPPPRDLSNASTNQGPGTHARIWMDRRFFVPGTVCDSWFLSIRVFFFSMLRLCSHGAAAGCLRDCSDSKVEPIANVAVLLRTLRPVASASTLRRERQGRRGVREARASPLRDLSRRRRTGSRPTAVSRARPSRARGS
jgi:hypothetical protein